MTVQTQTVMVGGREIDAAMIAAEMQHHPAPDPDTAWSAAAEALVIRQLLLDEADRLEIAAPDMVDGKGQQIAPDDARIEALIEQEVTTPRADEETCRRYYARHQERFVSPTLVEANHILFAASPDDGLAYGLATGDARTTINMLKANPDIFAELAKEKSACPSADSGGNLGQIGKGQTVAPFESALFSLREGELCDTPVKTQFGVHVMRAGRRIEGQQLPFEMIAQSIADYLEEASWRRAVSQYVSILASQSKLEGVTLTGANGPLADQVPQSGRSSGKHAADD